MKKKSKKRKPKEIRLSAQVESCPDCGRTTKWYPKNKKIKWCPECRRIIPDMRI